MRLEDGEVVLRPLEEGDAPALVAAIGEDPDLDRWTRIPFPYTEDHAREFIGSTEEIGLRDPRPREERAPRRHRRAARTRAIVEIGYWVKADARGRGVATRAVVLVARFAFDELGAARVQLVTEPDNVASQRVAEKAASPARASCARSSRAGAGTSLPRRDADVLAAARRGERLDAREGPAAGLPPLRA